MPEFAGIPPSLRQHARNLASWFPEVLTTLGAADLEDRFHQGQVNVREHEMGKTLEVVLPKKEPDKRQDPAPGSSLDQQIARLDRLASDFESLALQLQVVNSATYSSTSSSGSAPTVSGAPSGRCPTNVDARLDAATRELMQLSELIKARSPVEAAPCAAADAQPIGKQVEQHYAEEVREGARPELRSARGGQAQQGGQSLHGAGRSRNTNKVPDWKSQLKIEVTKVKEMPEGDPKSPKGKAPAQVWGASKASAKPPSMWRCDTPTSMQARIEQKLTMMLGQAPSSRPPQRRQTLPASAFNHSQIAALARLHSSDEASR